MRIEDTHSRRTRSKRGDILQSAPPMSNWPQPMVDDLPLVHQEPYLKACLAVKMWVAGEGGKAIFKQCACKVDEARRLVSRCIQYNPSTRFIVGFWACVPQYRLAPTSRERFRAFKPALAAEGKGLTGALFDLFRKHPAIEQKMRLFVQKRKDAFTAPVPILTPTILHKRFLALCKEEGLLARNEWPFTTKRAGYQAIRKWNAKHRFEAPIRSARNELGDQAGALAMTDYKSIMAGRKTEALLAYERVELDEHYQDAVWTIHIPMPGGSFEQISTTRLWALVLRDRGSKVILAARLSYRERYDRNDVLALIHDALAPPPRKILSFENPHYQYAGEACFPGELEDFRGNTWQCLAFDTDSTHLANQTLSVLKQVVGCDVANETVGQATARSSIEGFFAILARNYQQIPSATGSSPESPVRRDPEKAASRWNVASRLAEEVLDVFCRNHNATPSEDCGGLSPLQRLREMLAQGKVFRSPLGELREANLWQLLPVHPATVTRQRGFGPLGVNLYGGRYVGPELAKASELAYLTDNAVKVYVEEDARFAVVVPDAFPDRHYKVALKGRYAEGPHTLLARRWASTLAKNLAISGRARLPDVMTGLLTGLGELGKSDKAVASILNGTVAFMERNGRDETPYVATEPQEREALREWAQNLAEEGDVDGEDACEYGGEGTAGDNGKKDTPRPQPGPSFAPNPHAPLTPPQSDDIFGLL